MENTDNVPETWLTLRPPNCDPALALRYFHEALIRDCELYKNGNDAGREGAARALVHTITFLHKIGIPNPVIEPLDTLALALCDLNISIVSDILKPMPKGKGRRRRAQISEVRDGVIAAIAEGFQRAATAQSWSQDVAMRQAATAINASGNFAKVTATSVKNIRTRVTGDFDTFAKDQFDALTQSQGFIEDSLNFVRSYLASPFGGGNINLGK
jgi:hypothetical protein